MTLPDDAAAGFSFAWLASGVKVAAWNGGAAARLRVCVLSLRVW